MGKYIVQKHFEGKPGQHFNPGDRIDSDVVNSWRHGQRLQALRFIAPAPDQRRRGGKEEEANA